jgi:CheY-like chemotaxis protein
MESGSLYQSNGTGESKSSPIPKKCAWILGGAMDPWWAIALDLQQYGIEVRLLGSNADLREVVEQAELEAGVIVIDLIKDIERGFGIIVSCHSYSSSVPLIPVVADPSLDLTQRLRDLGTYCLAVHPVDSARMRTVLEDAFRHIDHIRLATKRDKKKILIIDDDQDYCRSVQALLQSEGYEVRCANSGSQGLDMAISIKPDLIVLDVMMENAWAGYEVSQTLKFRSGYESVRRVPIVMVSAIEEHPAERFAKSGDLFMAGPDVYLTKPIEVKGFVQTIHSLLKSEPQAQA